MSRAQAVSRVGRRLFLFAGLAACLVALPAARGQVQTVPVDVKGAIVAVTPTRITLQTETGDVFAATVGDVWIEDGVQLTGAGSTSYQITGVETREFLQAGMYVRFPARMEHGRRVLGEVSQIAVISRTPTSVFGVFPNEGAHDASEHDASAPDGGGAKEGASDAAERDKPVPGDGDGDDGADGKDEAGESVLVAGQLTKVSRGAITVVYPGGTTRAKLADDAVVTIDASELAFARVGDSIHATGQAVSLPRFFATRVVITRAAHEEGGRGGPRGVARNGKGGDKPERPDPFAQGDPRDKAADGAAAPVNVKGKILKVN